MRALMLLAAAVRRLLLLLLAPAAWRLPLRGGSPGGGLEHAVALLGHCRRSRAAQGGWHHSGVSVFGGARRIPRAHGSTGRTCCARASPWARAPARMGPMMILARGGQGMAEGRLVGTAAAPAGVPPPPPPPDSDMYRE